MAVWILILEAFAVYGLVLGTHSLRHRFGLPPFYALLGGITAVMSWVTDAGVLVQVGGISFLVGSTVFYTSILLGVFVVYIFDGPKATRIAISTVIGVSVMVPLIALVLHLQMRLMGSAPLGYVPIPSLRINTASVLATLMDLLFLAVSWEFFNIRLGRLHPALRAFLTLLGVMWLDVLLFNTGAFAGTPGFLATLTGTLVSRAVVCVFAAPLLWAYLAWQNRMDGVELTQRPLLAIIQKISRMEEELDRAQREIALRIATEKELRFSRERLALALEVSQAGVFEHDLPFTKELYLSPRWLALHGFSEDNAPAPDEFKERLDKVIHPDDLDAVGRAYRSMARGETSGYEMEYRVKGPGEGWLHLLTYGRAVSADLKHGKFRVVGVCLDITTRKEAERLARERAKLEGVMEMAGAACHELNQPLQVLFGQVDLLADACRLQPETDERIQAIQKHLLRFREITQRIQNITRYETKEYLGDSRIIDIRKSSPDK